MTPTAPETTAPDKTAAASDDTITIQPVDFEIQAVHGNLQFKRNETLHNVAIRIHDFGGVVAAAAGLAGHSEVAQAIATIARYAGIALDGAADADAIEITPESILALKTDKTPLAPPTDSGLAGGNDQTPPAQ